MKKKAKRKLCSHFKNKGNIFSKITEIIVEQMTDKRSSQRLREEIEAKADVAAFEIVSMLKIK